MWGSRGISERFVVSGDLLYAADGRGVAVYRVANPAAIERIDVELSDDRTLDIVLAGTDVFAATSRGLRRYAVAQNGTLSFVEAFVESEAATRVAADARWVATAVGQRIVIRERAGTTLAPLREIVFQNPVRALIFAGGILYAGIEREGVYVFDPLREEALTTLALNAGGFAQQGNVLWVAAGAAGITSLDVSFPREPRVTGNSGGGEVNVMDVAVAGTRAFGLQRPNKLYAFDISSTAAPRQTASLTGQYNAIAARGDSLFSAGSDVDAFGLDRSTGVPVRVHNAASLQVAGEYRDLAGPVSGAATDGSLAFVVDPPYFRVIDVHKTASPREIASIVVPGIQDRVRIRRNLAIVYGRGLVNLIDISNPYKPRHIGTYDGLGTPPSAAAIARDTIVEANYASGLHVVDYSDPKNAVQIAGRIWHYFDVVAGDDAVYAVLQNTLLVIDLTNRFQVVDAYHNTDIGALQAELAPANAPQPTRLLVRTPTAIHVFSLANRFQPVQIGVVPVAGAGIMGTTDTAGWFELNGTLAQIDLANPTTFSLTDFRLNAPMQIAGSGRKLVIADRYSLRVYGPDTAPPQPPPGKHRAARK